MILTVQDLRQALAGLPDTLPVRIECEKVTLTGDDCCAEQTTSDYADGVEFQGNHLLITCAD